MSSTALNISLIGFPAPEKATFETFFRLVSPRRPAPLVAAPMLVQAQIVLWNALSEDDRPQINPQSQRLISVGTTPMNGVWRHLSRPVNLNAVLQLLDAGFSELNALGVLKPSATAAQPSAAAALVEPYKATAPAVSVAPIASIVPRPVPTPTLDESTFRQPVAVPVTPVRPSIAPVRPPVAPVITGANPVVQPLRVEPTISLPPRVSADEPAPARSLSDVSNVAPLRPAEPARARTPAVIAKEIVQAQSAALHAETAPASVAGQTKILVVDDSDVALRFMHSRLSAFGFSVDLCGSGEEALVRVADGEYSFVFLDVMMEGLDGYQTCKAIKGRRYAGGKTPTVVMLTSRGGTIDKVRGTFAGCDAYLTKPLDESKMLKVLLRYSPELGDSVSTLGAPVNPHLPAQMPAVGKNIDTNNPKNPLAASFENLAAGLSKQRS